MRQVSTAVLILFSFSLFSCKDDSTATTTSDLQLTADYVEVTELSLRLRIAPNLQKSPSSLTLNQDGKGIASIPDPPADTLFIISGLAPKSNHTFQTKLQIFNHSLVASDPLTVTTMDTTSHNVTWEIDTLGDGANSSLRDVAIVNDTCVFAVGELHIRDSTGNWDPNLYNIAKWNGARWTYSTGASAAFNAVYAFSSTDVWAGTSAPHHFDGTTWRDYNVTGLFNGYVTKIWGTSSSNVYMVGTNGCIMHFNGASWTKMDSGTDVDLRDIWGSPDGSQVWSCGWIDFKPTILLSLQNGKWEKLWEELNPFVIREDSISGIISSIWTSSPNQLLVLSHYGLYRTSTESPGIAKRSSFSTTYFPGFPFRIRGDGQNDLTIVGEYSMIAHFNGASWKLFSSFMDSDNRLNSVDQRGGFVVAVGFHYDLTNGRGIVLRGRR